MLASEIQSETLEILINFILLFHFVGAFHSEMSVIESALTTASPKPIGLCAAQRQSIEMETSDTPVSIKSVKTTLASKATQQRVY
jgi:hypothetical protein